MSAPVEPEDGYTDPDESDIDDYDSDYHYPDCYCCPCCGHTAECYGIEEDEDEDEA